MIKYFVRRIMIYIPLWLAISVIIFTLSVAAPGDPTDWLNNPELQLSPEDILAAKIRMGLGDPPHIRYLKWLGQLLQGNLGYRLKDSLPIGPLILRRMLRTVLFTGLAMAIGLILGVTMGIYAALRQYSLFDYVAAGLSFIGISIPAFVLGITFLWLFALKLEWFPVGGIRTIGVDPTLGDFLHHLVLPVSILSLIQVTGYFRFMRMSMLETLHADYLVTAHAKGLPSRRVYLVHAVRNALIPLVTIIGMALPRLLAGAVFLESIFGWPGMGLLFIDGVHARDYPLIMAETLIIASAVLLANLVTDVTYAIIDPRIRLEARRD